MKENITRFTYMGDPQCSRLDGAAADYSGWCSLLKKARQTEYAGRLLILGGDIVNRRNGEDEWQAFFKAYDSAVEQENSQGTGNPGKPDDILVTPVNGARESIGRYSSRFLNAGNGPAGYENNFFSFDYGCCHFLVLDSDFMGNAHKDACKYIGYWIKADLSVNRQPVVFAVMHHPMFTIGTSFEDEVRAKAMRENYMGLLYKYGVDFILCGHQHAYCRTREMEAPAVSQIMGVSGAKHFDAWDRRHMEVCRENVSVATIFETDGDRITLKTIEETGRVLDEYAKAVHPPKERNCSGCVNFRKCGGTGEHERRESEKKAAELGDPLRPSCREGIDVMWDSGAGRGHVSSEKINKLAEYDVEYSMLYREGPAYENRRGFRLEDLLEAAGCDSSIWEEPGQDGTGTDFALILTSGNGRQRILNLRKVLEAKCFERSGAGEYAIRWIVPPIFFEEEGGYRFACGQDSPGHYNGRGWAADVREIEVRQIR